MEQRGLYTGSDSTKAGSSDPVNWLIDTTIFILLSLACDQLANEVTRAAYEQVGKHFCRKGI